MAFLDNSGDIILDVVLTDEGRKRLAQGDGSFQIDKFALGDDEINYALYNTTASSGLEDLQILQTPVLEAFTNNMSSMKSLLVSYDRNDLFYLPVIKLNDLDNLNKRHADGVFYVAVDNNTEDNGATTSPATSVALGSTATGVEQGFLLGANPANGGSFIRVDAGIDNSAELGNAVDSLYYETAYRVEIDNRLGRIVSKNGAFLDPVDVDDDEVATYILDSNLAAFRNVYIFGNTVLTQASSTQVIAGSRSTSLEFKVASSTSLRNSTYMFDLIGSTQNMKSPATPSSNGTAVKYIDSIVRVTGQLSGYSVDIPVRFVKNS